MDLQMFSGILPEVSSSVSVVPGYPTPRGQHPSTGPQPRARITKTNINFLQVIKNTKQAQHK